MLWWVERGERNREAASELVIMLIRMICGSPQNRERSLQRCSPAAACHDGPWWSMDAFSFQLLALRNYPRLQSTWLGPNPWFHFSQLGCALGPWRNQFKWLSVDVIDFHFTRLSWKMHYHPAPVYTLSHPIPSRVPHLTLIRIIYLQSQFSFWKYLNLEISKLTLPKLDFWT